MGKPNIAAGWTCIPNILVRRQRTLGLDSIDVNILLHLMTYWWEDGNLPHPSKETLAQAIGISASTVQRRIRAMEAGGFWYGWRGVRRKTVATPIFMI